MKTILVIITATAFLVGCESYERLTEGPESPPPTRIMTTATPTPTPAPSSTPSPSPSPTSSPAHSVGDLVDIFLPPEEDENSQDGWHFVEDPNGNIIVDGRPGFFEWDNSPDTDGDGIPNDQDPDIDGDGITNQYQFG